MDYNELMGIAEEVVSYGNSAISFYEHLRNCEKERKNINERIIKSDNEYREFLEDKDRNAIRYKGILNNLKSFKELLITLNEEHINDWPDGLILQTAYQRSLKQVSMFYYEDLPYWIVQKDAYDGKPQIVFHAGYRNNQVITINEGHMLINQAKVLPTEIWLFKPNKIEDLTENSGDEK